MTGDLTPQQRNALADLVAASGYNAAAAIIREDVRGFISVNDTVSSRSDDDLREELADAVYDLSHAPATRGKGGVILIGALGNRA